MISKTFQSLKKGQKWFFFFFTFFFFACESLFNQSVQAEPVDYSLSVLTRSYPFGLSLYGDMGLNQLLWGDHSSGNYFYGYLRPYAKVRSSVVVNRGEVGMDIFPLSFFGVRFGYGESFRNIDFDAVNCKEFYCRGSLGELFLKSSLTLGYQDFFIGGSLRVSQLYGPGLDRPFIDEYSMLRGVAGRDQLFSSELFVGYKFTENLNIGYYLDLDRMNQSQTQSSLNSLFFSLKQKEWKYGGGVGIYESTLQSSGLSVFGAISWVGASPLGVQ